MAACTNVAFFFNGYIFMFYAYEHFFYLVFCYFFAHCWLTVERFSGLFVSRYDDFQLNEIISGTEFRSGECFLGNFESK